MKSVLISIRPEWCDLIARGEKTLEVRKTKPKIDTPFKCYIYCTKATKGWLWLNSPNIRRDGVVIGEFICDRYVIDRTFGHDAVINAAACMTEIQCAAYSCSSLLYGWHISKLKIYEKPLSLDNFFHACDKPSEQNCSVCEETGKDRCKQLRHPPQSWCYVMEVN